MSCKFGLFGCVSTKLLDLSNGIRRRPDSDADREYAVAAGFGPALMSTLGLACFIVEMRSGTCAHDDDFVTLPS